MLDLALRLASRGWYVLPVDATEKRPIGQLVPNGHHGASTDPAVIRSWWAARPDARPAIALEQSGLVALDIEGLKKTPDGIESLKTIEAELTHTAAQATPSGGAHLIYRRTDDAQARRLIRWRPGVDLLGKGYVLAYDELAGEPAPLPEILAGAFGAKPAEKRSETEETDFEPASWELLAYAHRLAMAHGGKAKGEGGNQHAYALGAILRHDLALTAEEARPILLAWRDAFPETRGWREEYLLETAEHATRYATSPRGGRRAEIGVLAAAQPSEGGPGGPFVAIAGSEPGTWEHALLKAMEDLQGYRGTGAAAVGKLSKPAFTPATDLLSADFPPTPWLIQGLVTEQSVGITSAEPKSIKTWIELENALAVATGTPSMGRFATGAARPVALFLAEDDARAARNRLKSLCASRGLDPAVALARVHVCCRQHLDITNDADLIWILASCRQIPDLALIVLDPLRDIHAAEENDSTGMADVMGRLRALRDICGVSVRAPHHAKKDTSGSSRGGQNMRGSSAIHGALDCGLYLDGLDTDGRATWTVRATSEIKAAKGAGSFKVTLAVEDNAAGEAMKATWTLDEGERTAVDPGKLDQDAVLAAVRTNTAHQAWDHVWRLARWPDGTEVPQKRAAAALARLLADPAVVELDAQWTAGRSKVYRVRRP
jgi:hypothetical protein